MTMVVSHSALSRYWLLLMLAVACSFSLVNAKEVEGIPVPLNDDAVAAVKYSSAGVETSTAANQAQPPLASDFAAHFDRQHFVAEESELIPLFFIVFVFGGPFLLVGFLGYLRYRAKAQHRANLNLNIDKLLAAGRDIPVELLRGDEAGVTGTGVAAVPDDDGNLNKGIKNICVGIGLLIFLTLLCGIEIGALAFIIIGMGVSRVIIWKLTQVNHVQRNKAQD